MYGIDIAYVAQHYSRAVLVPLKYPKFLIIATVALLRFLLFKENMGSGLSAPIMSPFALWVANV